MRYLSDFGVAIKRGVTVFIRYIRTGNQYVFEGEMAFC